MFIAEIPPWMLFSIAGLAIAGFVILRIVGSMLKEKRTVGAIVILFGSLAMIGVMFTNFRRGNATRTLIDGVPVWHGDGSASATLPPVELRDAPSEAHAIEQQIAISNGASGSSGSRTLRKAKASVKRTLRNPSRAPLAQSIRTNTMSRLLTGVAIAAFLCVGYVFLDAATRGQFTWRLRIVAVVAFAAICVALQSLHQQL